MRRLCTYREPTDRRSWTSTSPLLTRILAVVAAEDVEEDAAVDVVGKVESSASVVKGQMENSVSVARDPRESTASAVNALKVIVHQDKNVMLLPAVEGAVEAVTNRNSTWTKRLSLLWDRSLEIAATSVRAWRGREHALIIVLTTYI